MSTSRWALIHLRRLGLALVLAGTATAVVVFPAGTRASAVGDFGTDTCLEGYVWRESVPADHVCVTAETRAQVQADNAAATERHLAGSDTCVAGYVWREAMATGEADYETAVANAYASGQDPTVVVQAHLDASAVGDHVCVTPDVRAQTAADNDINTWRSRVLLMTGSLIPYTSPAVLQGSGFNTGTVYLEIVRHSDGSVLWQADVAASPADRPSFATEGSGFAVTIPFNECSSSPDGAVTNADLVAYDYTAGAWRVHESALQLC